jgi:hypothetical protein
MRQTAPRAWFPGGRGRYRITSGALGARARRPRGRAVPGLSDPTFGESSGVASKPRTPPSAGAHCPHCHLLVEAGAEEPWPAAPVRCPHCHLLIGRHRARAEPSGEPGAKGTAAGVFSREAKRSDEEPAASEADVLAAIRSVADLAGEPPERLLMVDYQQMAAADPELPPLSDVFAAFGSWKAARQAAAS